MHMQPAWTSNPNYQQCLFEAGRPHAQEDFEHVRCVDGRATAYPAHQRLLNLSSADDLAAGVRPRHLRFLVEAGALKICSIITTLYLIHYPMECMHGRCGACLRFNHKNMSRV